MSIEMIAYDPVQGQVCWLTLREGFSNPTAAFGPGLAEYRPPPKTADSPWVPPTTSEALPIRAVAEPQEPKKETKKQEARTIPSRRWSTPDELKKSSAGRKPFDAILMFRMLVLQALNNLSDEQVEIVRPTLDLGFPAPRRGLPEAHMLWLSPGCQACGRNF